MRDCFDCTRCGTVLLSVLLFVLLPRRALVKGPDLEMSLVPLLHLPQDGLHQECCSRSLQ
jgi:hypothetical protein